MAYVIAEPCITEKDTACVNVCPVDCIHPKSRKADPNAAPEELANFEAANQLYIDPDTCIDCGACVPECPVSAIFPLDDLKDEWKHFADENADWYRLSPAEFKAKYNLVGKTY